MKIVFFVVSGNINYVDHIMGVVNLIINPLHSYAVFIWFAYVLFILMAIIHRVDDKYMVCVFMFSVLLYVFREYTTGYIGINQISKYALYFMLPWFLFKEHHQRCVLRTHLFDISLIYPFVWAVMTFIGMKLLKYRIFNFFRAMGKDSDAIYYVHPFLIAIFSVFLPDRLICNIIIGLVALFSPMLMCYVVEKYKFSLVGKLMYGKK